MYFFHTPQHILPLRISTHIIDYLKLYLDNAGNMLVPNENYCKFEDWISPVLDKMHEEQDSEGTIWTPSKMIHRFGREIMRHCEEQGCPEKAKTSVCYWAYKNDIPIFCPSITDGSIGDMM
jgi:deoxyhypusine synthase